MIRDGKGDLVPREGKISYGWWIAATFFVTLFMAASIGATHSMQSYHMAFVVFLAVQLLASIAIFNCRPLVAARAGD